MPLTVQSSVVVRIRAETDQRPKKKYHSRKHKQVQDLLEGVADHMCFLVGVWSLRCPEIQLNLYGKIRVWKYHKANVF